MCRNLLTDWTCFVRPPHYRLPKEKAGGDNGGAWLVSIPLKMCPTHRVQVLLVLLSYWDQLDGVFGLTMTTARK